MTILVTYGSVRGGTAGLANMVADGLRAEGFAVEVKPVSLAEAPDAYEAVIIGGALYAMRWHADSRRYVRRHASALRGRPTYLFSSGPLDDSAGRKEIPPVKGVRHLMETAGARRHATFGGRLLPEAHGLVAHQMARKLSGDWRDANQVREWTAEIAADLRAGEQEQRKAG